MSTVDDDRDCWICDEPVECSGDCGDGYYDPYDDGGCSCRPPDHCCLCGGSPYCNCCRSCGAMCVGQCACPISIELIDGGKVTL